MTSKLLHPAHGTHVINGGGQTSSLPQRCSSDHNVTPTVLECSSSSSSSSGNSSYENSKDTDDAATANDDPAQDRNEIYGSNCSTTTTTTPAESTTYRGKFQHLYNNDVLVQRLGALLERMQARAEALAPWPRPIPLGVHARMVKIERCALLFREAKRALQQGRLMTWMTTYSCYYNSNTKECEARIPLVEKVMRVVRGMEERRRSCCVQEGGDAIDRLMDAVIVTVVVEVFGMCDGRTMLIQRL